MCSGLTGCWDESKTMTMTLPRFGETPSSSLNKTYVNLVQGKPGKELVV